MTTVLGVDLGSTTTKAVLLDENGEVIGRGITNSRSNYDLAASLSKVEALANARFTLFERELERDETVRDDNETFRTALQRRFRLEQYLSQLKSLRERGLQEAESLRPGAAGAALRKRLEDLFSAMERRAQNPLARPDAKRSEFFRDEANAQYARLAEDIADKEVSYDQLLAVFDKAIVRVENEPLDVSFEAAIRRALDFCIRRETLERATRFSAALERVAAVDLEPAVTIGTGYGRARLPFPKEQIRSEILCHGLGAHALYPGTRTVLDIGGQDTKAIQVDGHGIVTGFQMNDRCAAGCGRYLGYIADEMNLGLHELGPLAQQATRHVKINSTCTVFAGAELRDRLTLGERREDILAGLHRAIILRAMALLARSGGVFDELTFTGGVASNPAAVDALGKLVHENYGRRTLNISPSSIYTGALGAALFAHRVRAPGSPA
ncbi:MAG: benzoyl-CoA reductase subunit A [Deltaproteobacteria bacterium]|nr:benzoyl-CoA reductase subunit A [Deltaproteobacteria bacterium]